MVEIWNDLFLTCEVRRGRHWYLWNFKFQLAAASIYCLKNYLWYPWIWYSTEHSNSQWCRNMSTSNNDYSILFWVPEPKLLHLDIWMILNILFKKEMGIPDHLTCLLTNLSAGQEATLRTEHGKTDWFQIGKGVRQGCILSPWLFNYIQSTSWEMLGWMKHKL